MIRIKHRWTGYLLCEFDVLTMKEAVEKAVKNGTDLGWANLGGAGLFGANLRGANLRGAELGGADLGCTDLFGTDLRGSNLRGTDLRDADLGGANLGDADLLQFKTDYFDILLRSPKEIKELRNLLVNGKVDGSIYKGDCACQVGSIANIRHCNYKEIGNGISPNLYRPAEQWFMMIKKGDTPETNYASKLAVKWIDEFTGLLEMKND